MKQVLPFFASALLFTACTSTPAPNAATPAAPALRAEDTIGLAQFQAWKTQNERASCQAYQAAPKAALSAHKANATRMVRNADTQSGSMTSESQNAAKAPVKKGWSKAAKGAAIGAGAGATAGVIINKKNRAVGGVIGGVAGGAVGYGIGRHIDKKDGRY